MKEIILLIPSFLVWLRFLIAPMLLVDASDHKASKFFLLGFVVASISDLLDGVIARRLKIVTSKLRILDSYADIALYSSLLISIWLTNKTNIQSLLLPFWLVILLQLINWGASLIKFGKLTSYHSYLAKIRAFALFIAVIALFQFQETRFFWLSIIFATASHIEGIIITFLLPCWHHDVWTISEAIKIRNQHLKTIQNPNLKANLNPTQEEKSYEYAK